jgi:hypothetical protein
MAFRGTLSPGFDCIVRVGDQGIAMGVNSLSVWFKLDNVTGAHEMIEINGSNGTAFESALIMNGNKVEYSQRSASAQINFLSGTALTANVWHHAALTYDGTTLRGYLDGVADGTATGLTGTRGNWSDVQMGPTLGELQDGCFYTVALTAEEITQLYRNRLPGRRDGLQFHLPCFPGATNRLIDYSGNALNFSNNGTPVDATTWPQVPWGDDGGQVILLPDGDLPIDAAGSTQTTGSAALTASAGLVPSGLTQTTGAATMTSAAALAASGLTQTTGSAAVTSAAALVPSGLTRTTGAASFGSVTFPVVASGLTQTTGSATLTAAAPLVAAGLTQTTGSAAMTAAAAIVASGLTQTTGIATLGGATPASGLTQTTGAAAMTAAASISATGTTQTSGAATMTKSAGLAASGLTQTSGSAAMTSAAALAASGTTQTSAAAAMTAAAALTASGLTRTTGAAALSSAAALAASGVTQTTGAATLTVSANINITASGLTRTTGAAEFFVPVVDIPQRWTAAPRQTLWITTNPFQPQDYASVLGSKLVDYWHSELGIALDGSSNVQTWTGQLLGLVLNQTLGAGQRPNYGADASFGGRNVVQCRITGPRCLAYKPGSAIFNPGDRPGLVHISRYATVPTGATATYIVNMGAANAPTPPAIFNNDFFDGTIITTAQRRGVGRTVNHFTPFGLTVFDPVPVTTSPSMRALGLTSTQFQVYTNGQLAGFLENNENLSESWDQLVIGANTESGLQPCDCNVAMVFLCRNMPSQFEAMQLYQLAKAEWGI